jgi:hypothetical protein
MKNIFAKLVMVVIVVAQVVSIAQAGDLVVMGKVGVGTATPNTILHVNDAAGSSTPALTGYTYYPNIYNKNTYPSTDNSPWGSLRPAIMGESIGGRGVVGTTRNGTAVYGTAWGGTGNGVIGNAQRGYGVWGRSSEDYGGYFETVTGDAAIYAAGCDGCSVISEMSPVGEMPDNGQALCYNRVTSRTEVCREDKSSRFKGLAQERAEQILRVGCSRTLEENGSNGMDIGVMDVGKWRKKEECRGWYPVALSGLSEGTPVVCQTPLGRRLGYGDVLVTSVVPGHLRPLDDEEDVKPYQMAGRAENVCAYGMETDLINVWVK